MVAIAILVIGAAAVVAGVTMMSASRTARAWPVVSGEIIQRGVGPSTTTGASRPGKYFEPKVTYSYQVGAAAFTGHRISLTTKAYDEDTAKKVANELPDSVEVHYNPADPSDAVLDPGSIGVSILLVIGGIIAALIGGGLVYTSFTR